MGSTKNKALKCSIHVVAGIMPGEPLNELSRSWQLTTDEIEEGHNFCDAAGAAANYALSLQNPKLVNWVRLEWIWY